jgi:hypothetical protein
MITEVGQCIRERVSLRDAGHLSTSQIDGRGGDQVQPGTVAPRSRERLPRFGPRTEGDKDFGAMVEQPLCERGESRHMA